MATSTTKKAAAKKAAAKDPAKEAQDSGLRKAYGLATTRLRERHRDEFQALYAEAAEELGVEYKPRLTPEQKAEATVAELLEKFPHLRDQLVGSDEADEEYDEDDEGAEVKDFTTAR